MDAGVAMKKPVSGIAMGLIKNAEGLHLDRRRNCPSRFARCWNQLVFDAYFYRLDGYRFLLSQ